MVNNFQRHFHHLLQEFGDLENDHPPTYHQLQPRQAPPPAPVLPIPRPAQPAPPPPQPDHPLPHDQEDDSFRIVRGRTKNSENCLYRGYRYSKDGKPSSRTGKQAWRCVLRSNGGCKGRLHSLDGKFVSVAEGGHNHEHDLTDCEVKATLSKIKDLATSSR